MKLRTFSMFFLLFVLVGTVTATTPFVTDNDAPNPPVEGEDDPLLIPVEDAIADPVADPIAEPVADPVKVDPKKQTTVGEK